MIKFEQVSKTYPGGQRALSKVDFHIAPGEMAFLTGHSGAGKSTLLPLALLNAPWLAGKKIVMLEPRRLAAKTIANRMADLLGEKVGEWLFFHENGKPSKTLNYKNNL